MSANYRDLLKYAATGIASPSMTYYDKMRASTLMGGSAQTLTGQPPLSFKSDGTPLISWSMLGNSSQDGTPTPDNPVMPEFVGVRTANLFDGVYTVAIMSVSGNTASLYTASSGRIAIVKCEPNTIYTVKKYGDSNRFIIAESNIKPVNGTAMPIIMNDSSKSEYSFTTSNTTQYVAIYCSTSSEQAEPPLMITLGDTALPYEPFGYKIPITCAGQTTPVYLGEVPTVRRVLKLVFDGTENWRLYKLTGATNVERFYLVVSKNAISPASIISTHFPTLTDNSDTEHTRCGGSPINEVYIYISRTVATTVADLKSYLAQQYAAGTPVTVWYVLATPETAIVNEPLCKIGDYADELSSVDAGVTIPTAKGENTLTVETELKPSEMTIKYHE